MATLRRLFEPIRIRGMELKNRYVMAPMATNFANTDGSVTQRLIDYHVARARGGVGLITLEAAFVRPDGAGHPRQLGIHRDDMIPGLQRLVDAVHEEGAKISAQLYHAGRQTSSLVTGLQPVAPSAIPCPIVREIPHQLSVPQIRQIHEDFAVAAHRAVVAGFDSVEIHGAHGYLISQFLSPFSNRRLDEYGAGLLGRARFAIEVVEKVRQAVGNDFPIIFRMSGDELIDGGLTLLETKAIAPLLVEAGVDALHVSAGNYATPGSLITPPMEAGQAVLVGLAEAIRRVCCVPIIAVGRLHDPLVAEQVLQEEQADLIAVGRALLADPELPNKVRRGDLEEILPCIACNQACISRVSKHEPVACVLNPACGREREFALTPTDRSRKVLVIGGGPAGLEAARVSALRGHDVTLLETREHLGGEFLAGSVPPHKEVVAEALSAMARQVYKAGVRVSLGVKANARTVIEQRPDVAIIATGGEPVIPDCPGIDSERVVLARDVLLGKAVVGNQVLVVGGGLGGLDVAQFLVAHGRNVTIVEMMSEVGREMQPGRRYWTMRSLEAGGVKIVTSTRLKEVGTDGIVYVEQNGITAAVGRFDSIVLATGYRPTGDAHSYLSGLVSEVYVVGDALKCRTVEDAIYEAAVTARSV